MEPKTIGTVIKASLIAGLIAALLVAAFHFIVTEPVMDRAIELESLLSQAAGHSSEEAIVSRDMQKVGLFVGFLIYGLIWALLLSVVYHLIQSLLPSINSLKRPFLVALLTGWSVALFPFLKYPANPPGVGDPETVGLRQTLYLTFIVLSAVNMVVATALHRYLSESKRASFSKPVRWMIVLGVYVVGTAITFIAMPVNGDPIQMPADLVLTFRSLSLAGLAIFWMVFAGIFAWLILRRQRPSQQLTR